jgi:uncharacterized secreted protein with C-terminal beta-propeller domain
MPTSTVAAEARAQSGDRDATSASGADPESAWGGTNVQEEGVDEPDTLKTDGRHLLTSANGVLRIIDMTTPEPQQLSEVAVPYGAQLLVDGDTVLTVATGPDGMSTVVSTVNVSDPAEPTSKGQTTLDGTFVSARLVDGMARVVTTTGSPVLAFVEPTASRATETARRKNLDVVRGSAIDDWLPSFAATDARGRTVATGPMVDCASVYVPEQPVQAAMVNVISLDLREEELRPIDGASVVGAGGTVYASSENLYVTSSAFVGDATTPSSATDVHKFSIAGRAPASYLASGRVTGMLLNQFSMSEHNGDLRIAVTTDGAVVAPSTTIASDSPVPGLVPVPVPATQSSVVVLREADGELIEVGRVDGLGQGEQIRSVRFIGDTGYVVTFRQTDPLYTIDLSDPAAPRVVGELKIPGYSSYLHPAGEGLLIGIGQDATTAGQILGLQLALFDVSDPAAPRQLQKVVLPNASSAAEGDHHAFLWWAEQNLAVVPVIEYGAFPSFQGGVGFSLTPDSVDERGRVGHDGGTPIERFVVVQGALVSLSADGLAVTDPTTFTQQSWLPFR